MAKTHRYSALLTWTGAARGPTADSRTKPTICAPGVSVRWQWAAAVYTAFGATGDALAVRLWWAKL